MIWKVDRGSIKVLCLLWCTGIYPSLARDRPGFEPRLPPYKYTI